MVHDSPHGVNQPTTQRGPLNWMHEAMKTEAFEGLGVSARAFLFALWFYVGKDSMEAWPSVETIGARAGLGTWRSSSRAAKKLVESGLVVRVERAGQSPLWRLADVLPPARTAPPAVATPPARTTEGTPCALSTPPPARTTGAPPAQRAGRTDQYQIKEQIIEPPNQTREAVAAQADRLVGCEAPPDLTALAKRLAEVYPRVSGNSYRRAFVVAAQSEAADSGRTVLEAAEWIVERAKAHWAVAVGHDPGAKTNRLVKRLDNWLADGCYGSDPEVTMGHLGPEPERQAPLSFEQVRKQEEEAQMERAMAIYREQNGVMA